MKEGFWRVRYASPFGEGFGLLTLDTGLVVGVDASDAIWNGTYEFNQHTGLLDIHLTVRFAPASISMVTAASGEHTETYDISLPNDLGREQVIDLTVIGRPMRVNFKKIREFP